MAVHPGRSIPKLCRDPYAVKATYNLFQHTEATPEHIQSGHRALVLEAMRHPGVSLLWEDTTELSWSGQHSMAGLGPIGNSAAGLQGFFVHTVLRVRWHDAPQDNSKRRPVTVRCVIQRPGSAPGASLLRHAARSPWERVRESDATGRHTLGARRTYACVPPP